MCRSRVRPPSLAPFPNSNSIMKKVCRAIIVNEEGKVLLGKREHGMGVNQYALIGGKPDGDETLAEAIVREVKEEIGLDFRPKSYLQLIDDYSVPGEEWLVEYFTGDADGDLILKEDEVLDIVFVSKEDLDSFSIAFNHREILEGFFSKK